MQEINKDVLVIGAGAAGIRAALAASEIGVDVLMVAKDAVGESGSTFSPVTGGWGIQALIGNERTEQNLENFFDDIIRVGLGRCNPGLVRILVEESGPRLEDLIDFGVQFKKDTRANFIRAKGCFSDVERAFITDDFQNLKQSFKSMIAKSGIKSIQGSVLCLITVDHTCWGAWVINESKEIIQITAKSTILATGGGAGIFIDHLASHHEAGEGYALAHNAGAELTNLEFIQFMLGLKQNGARYFLPMTELKNPGVLLDVEGADIIGNIKS